MSARLLPAAEHLLDVAVYRAVKMLRAGARVEEAAAYLVVHGTAADMLDTEERETLQPHSD